MADLLRPGSYTVDAAAATGVAIGDHAQVIQHIAAVYNIQPAAEGRPRITARLKVSPETLLARHTFFGGRDEELARLDAVLETRPSGYLFVTGPSGFGKTALLAHWVQRLEQAHRPVCYHFLSRVEQTAGEEDLLRDLCQQLTAYHALSGELPASVAELRALYPQLLAIPPAEGQKLAVLLEGLDEATGWQAGPRLFPAHLPEGLFVVFSAKTVANLDWLVELRLPPQQVELLEVSALGPGKIADLLRAAADGAGRWAEDPAFVREAYRKSGGDPFYLHYLVEDIRSGLVTSLADLERQPTGLPDYLKRWWRDVSQAVGEEAVRDLLGYLLVAKGRLSRDTLTDISAGDALDGWVFDRTIDKVQRYLVGSGNQGYALCHPRFQEYLAQEEIRESDQRPYRERLLAYCARWPEHRDPYALQYYAEYLRDEGAWSVLISLGRDPAFAQAQRERLPGQPDLPLKTLQIAFQAAAEIDDAAAMAEFLCLHALGRSLVPGRGSPLDALRASDWQRAWELAGLYDAELSCLWILLLAWDLVDGGRPDDATALLERLLEKPLPCLSGWQSGDFAHLFLTAFRLSPELGVALQGRLLDEEGRVYLGQFLVESGLLPAARQVAGYVHLPAFRYQLLALFAVAHARAEEPRQARASLDEALTLCRGLQPLQQIPGALGWLGGAQAFLGWREEALATWQEALTIAHELEDPAEAGSALLQIAAEQVDAGERALALDTLSAVLDLAAVIGDEATRADLFHRAAKGQAQAGGLEAGQETLHLARQAAAQIEDPDVRAEVLAGIVQAALAGGDVRLAQQVAGSIEGEFVRAGAWVAIGEAQVLAGDLAAARETLDVAGEPWARDRILAKIAQVQAAGDEPQAAAGTVAEIGEGAARAEALREVAVVYLQAGKPAEGCAALLQAARVAQDAPERFPVVEDWIGEVARPSAQALGAVAASQARAGEGAAARATYAALLDAEHRVEEQRVRLGTEWARSFTLKAIVDQQIEAGSLDEALELAAQIQQPRPRAEALTGIGRALALAGRQAAAQAAFVDAVASARLMDEDEVSPDWTPIRLWRVTETVLLTRFTLNEMRSRTLSALAAAQAEAGDFAAALDTAGKIAADAVRVGSLWAIGEAQERAGLPAEAGTTFAAARAAAGLDGAAARPALLAALAQAQAQAGRFEVALETAEEIPADLDRAGALIAIASSQAQAGQLEAAADTFDWALALALDVEDRQEREDLLMDLGDALVSAGFSDAALDLLGDMEDEELWWQLFEAILTAKAEAGALAEALDLARESQAPEVEIETYLSISRVHLEAGDLEAAQGAASAALTLVEAHPEMELAGFYLLQAAQALAETGDLPATQRALTLLIHEGERAEVVATLAAAQAAAGRGAQALETTSAILIRRSEHLPSVAAALLEAGDREHFKRLLLSCAPDLNTNAAFRMGGLLAQAYPEQRSAVGRILARCGREATG